MLQDISFDNVFNNLHVLFSAILDLAVDILAETGMVESKVAAAAAAAGGIDTADVEIVARSSAALMWEFAKAGTAEGATVAAVLLQLGLPEQLGAAFAEVINMF
jgi:hypothetical protein